VCVGTPAMVLCWLYFVGTSPFAVSNKLDLFIAVSVELTDVSPQVFDLRLVLNAGESHFGTRGSSPRDFLCSPRTSLHSKRCLASRPHDLSQSD
jgi:hypothetical protein